MDYSNIYRPLDRQKREVRFLRMQHDDDSEIKCHLEVHSLDSELDYLALSYCWTEEAPTRRILLEGVRFSVRPNLHEYLKVMSKERESSLVFVDAVCINQDDEFEKIDQIRLMGHIYRDARGVVAWLGTVYNRNRAVTNETLLSLGALCHSEEGIKSIQGNEDLINSFIVVWLEHRYWSRTWIMQEIMLARSLLLRFRDLQMPAHLASSCLKRLFPQLSETSDQGVSASIFMIQYDRSIKLPRGARYFPGRILPQRLRKQLRLRRALTPEAVLLLSAYNMLSHNIDRALQSSEGLPRPITTAVKLSVAQQCAVLHDKIFGILGLCESVLKPDYSMPKIELYLRVLVEGLITSRLGARVIRDAHKAERRQEFFPGLQDFISALLAKMNLSSSHLTVALITIQALTICMSISIAVDFFSELIRMVLRDRWKIPVETYIKGYLARLLWHKYWNSRMSTPPDPDRAGKIECTKRFSEWLEFVHDIAVNVATQMRNQASSLKSVNFAKDLDVEEISNRLSLSIKLHSKHRSGERARKA